MDALELAHQTSRRRRTNGGSARLAVGIVVVMLGVERPVLSGYPSFTTLTMPAMPGTIAARMIKKTRKSSFFIESRSMFFAPDSLRTPSHAAVRFGLDARSSMLNAEGFRFKQPVIHCSPLPAKLPLTKMRRDLIRSPRESRRTSQASAEYRVDSLAIEGQPDQAADPSKICARGGKARCAIVESAPHPQP